MMSLLLCSLETTLEWLLNCQTSHDALFFTMMSNCTLSVTNVYEENVFIFYFFIFSVELKIWNKYCTLMSLMFRSVN